VQVFRDYRVFQDSLVFLDFQDFQESELTQRKIQSLLD
jgi:hypothetical protein